MKRSIAGLVGLVFISLGFRLPSSTLIVPERNDKFVIYVVGKGLTGSTFSDPDCNKPEQQLSACAIARGVHAAYVSDEFQKFTSFIEYREADDRGSLQGAKALARQLADDPHVLAVIGHSYSETTGKAAPIYAETKIPLLIPIATSPTVGYISSQTLWTAANGSEHLQNVFRLIPNDRIGQAPSVAYIVAKLKSRETLQDEIVVDLSENKQYAQGLQKELGQKLPDTPMAEIDESCKDMSTLPPSCFKWKDGNTRAVSPDLLIFVGTGETANRFLKLAIVRRDASFNNLKYVLMTDGTKNVDVPTMAQLISTGIPLLLTFPTKQIFPQDRLSPGFAALKDALPKSGTQSYEEYGFDSLILMSRALTSLLKSAQPISRETVIRELTQIDAMHGATSLFIFHEGENVHPDYGVYGAGTDQQLDRIRQIICEPHHLAPPPDQQVQPLRYLCYIGFDEVNFM
jgi:ABC-type branched-subunit amino acid transport system substrate-binding protein